MTAWSIVGRPIDRFAAVAAGFEPRASAKALALLVERGLLDRTDDDVGSASGPHISSPRYSVPIPVYIQWCEWASGRSG